MKLDYKIILFENDSEYVSSLIRVLTNYLEDLGFELKCAVEPNGNRLDYMIEKEDWNLILMDYNLNTGSPKGDELIGRIRDLELFTEIIFYSDNRDFKDDISMTLPEGVYFARGREELREKAKKIINLTLKKNQDINNLRGLVIAETIDLVDQMDKIIIKHLKLEPEKINFFKDRILAGQFFNDYEKFKVIKKILLEEIALLEKKIQGSTSDDEKQKYEEIKRSLSELKQEFSNIQKEVIENRNHFAHATLSQDKKNTLVCSINGEKTPMEFNEEKCKEIRKNFIKHSENLNKIIEHI